MGPFLQNKLYFPKYNSNSISVLLSRWPKITPSVGCPVWLGSESGEQWVCMCRREGREMSWHCLCPIVARIERPAQTQRGFQESSMPSSSRQSISSYSSMGSHDHFHSQLVKLSAWHTCCSPSHRTLACVVDRFLHIMSSKSVHTWKTICLKHKLTA